MARRYIPERNHIVWIDLEPKKGREVGKYRPSIILSSKEYNKKTGIIICCPISTSIRGHMTEVPVNNLDKPSVVAASIVQTLSWRDRKIKYIVDAESNVFEDTLMRLLPLMGADRIL
ncbi:MAG: MazF family transcriptional regulator [Gammaproteobacteria bacterium RIFCSPHIGHO2_12_FULL_41_15]|nr:MAG: MazF family transcriptional regulator [Gammaproteobacteria bacterium RIFCSPHIGHO2_12_FULL_41_15]